MRRYLSNAGTAIFNSRKDELVLQIQLILYHAKRKFRGFNETRVRLFFFIVSKEHTIIIYNNVSVQIKWSDAIEEN